MFLRNRNCYHKGLLLCFGEASRLVANMSKSEGLVLPNPRLAKPASQTTLCHGPPLYQCPSTSRPNHRARQAYKRS
jgi:hypothetical protein